MKLGTATTDIADMFSGKKQYQIPFYQRRYVWDQKNWEPLWEDIIQLPEKHFAGTIITYEQRDKSVEIVDGQQRLTTFQIIFCVIRDLWDLKAYPASEEDTSVVIERKRSEIIRYIVQDAPGEPPRILPAKRDREYFESVFSRKLWEKLNIQEPSACLNAFKSLQDSSEHPIIAAYGFFGLKIITYLESCENVPETFRELADILRNFRVINAELDSKSGYDPEEIFQIINDTGRMLDDFDYLRNYLFLRTKKYLQNEDVTENEEVAKELDILYDNHWDKFEGEDWNSEKLNLFFRAFLMAKLGPTLFDSEDKDIQPFDCYRKHIKIIEEGQDQKFSPLLQLSCYADFYEKLNNSTTSVEEASDLRKLGNRIRFYDDLKLPPLDWFLLFMNPPKLPDSESCKEDSTELSKKDLNKLCDILESYIIRKWLCDGNYEGSYERIKTFCSEQLNGKTTVTVQKFVEHLSEQWPDPDRVQEVLQERADVVTPDLVLYILYRIEHPNDPVVATQIKKLFSDSNFLHELITCSPSDGWEDLLTETDNIAGRIGNSIGNIESKTTVSVSGWNIEKIHSRIEKLLECFNKIWKPEARDYR